MASIEARSCCSDSRSASCSRGWTLASTASTSPPVTVEQQQRHIRQRLEQRPVGRRVELRGGSPRLPRRVGPVVAHFVRHGRYLDQVSPRPAGQVAFVRLSATNWNPLTDPVPWPRLLITGATDHLTEGGGCSTGDALTRGLTRASMKPWVGFSLLTLGAASIRTDREGSRRIVWVIKTSVSRPQGSGGRRQPSAAADSPSNAVTDSYRLALRHPRWCTRLRGSARGSSSAASTRAIAEPG